MVAATTSAAAVTADQQVIQKFCTWLVGQTAVAQSAIQAQWALCQTDPTVATNHRHADYAAMKLLMDWCVANHGYAP